MTVHHAPATSISHDPHLVHWTKMALLMVTCIMQVEKCCDFEIEIKLKSEILENSSKYQWWLQSRGIVCLRVQAAVCVAIAFGQCIKTNLILVPVLTKDLGPWRCFVSSSTDTAWSSESFQHFLFIFPILLHFLCSGALNYSQMRKGCLTFFTEFKSSDSKYRCHQ